MELQIVRQQENLCMNLYGTEMFDYIFDIRAINITYFKAKWNEWKASHFGLHETFVYGIIISAYAIDAFVSMAIKSKEKKYGLSEETTNDTTFYYDSFLKVGYIHLQKIAMNGHMWLILQHQHWQ